MNRLIDILILNSPSSGLSDMAKLDTHTGLLCLLLHVAPLRLLCLALERCHLVSISTSQISTNIGHSWAGLPPPAQLPNQSLRLSGDGRGISTSRLKWRQVPRMSFRPSFLPATSRNNTGECHRSATLFVPFRFSQMSPDIWDIASSPMSVRKTNKSLFSWYQLHPLFWTVGMTLQTNSRKGRLFAIYTFSKEH